MLLSNLSFCPHEFSLRPRWKVIPIVFAVCIWMCSIASADVIHRWSFDGTTEDSVGGADAVLIGGATVSASQLFMNGTNQYAMLPIDSTLANLNSTTIEAWGTYSSLTEWARIFDFGNGDRTDNPGQGYLALTGAPDYGNGPISFAQFTITQTTNVLSENLYGGAIPGPGVELHYAVVIDHVAELGTLYVNGQELISQMMTFTPASVMTDDGIEHNWLGRSRFNQDAYMNGSINEFRIYDEALSDAEVLESYNNGVNMVPEPTSVGMFAVIGLFAMARRRRPI